MTDKPEKKTSLWQLTQDELDYLWSDPEDWSDEDHTRFNKTQMASEEKLDRYLLIIESAEHQSALATAEFKSKEDIIKRASKRATFWDNKVADLKRRMLKYMLETEKDNLVLPSGKIIDVQISGTRTKISKTAKMSMWDDIYYETKYIPNKDAIKAAFKDKPRADWPDGVEIITEKKVVLK